MQIVSNIVLYTMMAFVLIGAAFAIRNSDSGIGKEFLQGIHSIGHLFVPVAGIMASIPYLTTAVEKGAGPIWQALGADPSIAATTFIASDMGGYQLAFATAGDSGAWITAMVTGFMAGATIVFTVPVGLAMLQKTDQRYMALGIMSGVLTIPIGVLVTMVIIMITRPLIRGDVRTTGPSETVIDGLNIQELLANLLPLLLIVVAIAAGLKFAPGFMIKAFIMFGRLIDAAVKIILALSIVEYFTGIFTKMFGAWGFEPIIATADDHFRALEVVGAVGIMLAGAFPMVYAINKFLAGPLSRLGNRVGISETGVTGMLGGAANALALFHVVKNMSPRDKVISIAFVVCGGFLLGDHLSFTANFQPNLIGAVLVGKLTAAILAIVLARYIAVPTAERLAQKDEPFLDSGTHA
jgi:ethanolamine transporter